MPIDYLYYHCKAIEEAEDRADRELEEETNDVRSMPNSQRRKLLKTIFRVPEYKRRGTEKAPEQNDARELTIKDYKKDFGYGRYNVRGGGESIYEGNSLSEAIKAMASHFAALPNNHVHPVFKDILNKIAFPGVRA